MSPALPVESFLLFSSGPGTAAWNMAMDEALLGRAGDLPAPLLRFYGWLEPAASFGYFQKIAEVEQATPLRPLVRRPTGGGLVPHDADWTYSTVIPPTHPWYRLKAEQSYERMHRWVQNALRRLGLETVLAPQRRWQIPGQCFAGWEKNDVLWGGRKIAGAAQRRTRTGLLIQGSVQPPAGLERAAWEQAMQLTGWPGVQLRWQPFVPPEAWVQWARELATQKYSQPAYNRMR